MSRLIPIPWTHWLTESGINQSRSRTATTSRCGTFPILQGGHFGILATGVDNLTIENLKIDTNRDGMDIDCCRNVKISDTSINSPGDDGLCLKSSYGLGVVKPCENVNITKLLRHRRVRGGQLP